MGTLVQSEPLGDDRFRDVFEDAGQRIEIAAEVERQEPPHLLVVDLRASSFEAKSTQRLEEIPGGTRLTTCVETVYTRRLARLVGALVTRRAQRQLETDLETLKELVEAG
jgi:hypothetical protein